jgi:hypothetical protein
MTLPIARLLLALALFVSGIGLWNAAGVALDLATRHEQSALLQDDALPRPSRWRASLERVLDPTTGPHRLARDYWNARYDALTADLVVNDADPVVLLTAANAAFRKAQNAAEGRAPSVERLDQTLQAYAAALKNGGFDRDAAYNYEFVARLRDNIARSKPGQAPAPLLAPPSPARSSGALPAGQTIHGRPGTHPPNTRGEDFEVLTPMDYGEREAQPEPTPGKKLPRKG